MKTGELDWCYEEKSFPAAVQSFRERHPDVEVEVKDWFGPAGGWPVVRLRGSRSALRKALVEWDNGDPDYLVEVLPRPWWRRLF